MPISKTIIKSIENLDDAKEIKDLMITILEKEDNGIKKYKNEYNTLVSNFIRSQEKEENHDGYTD